MKRILLGVLLSMLLWLPGALAYQPSDFFIELTENKADLTGGYAIFELKNPTPLDIDFKNTALGIDIAKADRTGGITGYEFFYWGQTAKREKVSRWVSKPCPPESNVTACGEWKSDYREKVVWEWKPMGNNVLKAGETAKIKLVAHWKAELGHQARDWIPYIELNQERLSRPEWAWWNASWWRKRAITINLTKGTTPQNYTILLNISYDSDMEANFSDIRFVNGSENTALSYWIRDFAASDYANVWVRIDQNITPQNYTIYMYYDNGTTADSLSSNIDTFFGGDGGFDSATGWVENDPGSGISINTSDSRLAWEYFNMNDGGYIYETAYRNTSNFSISLMINVTDDFNRQEFYFGAGTNISEVRSGHSFLGFNFLESPAGTHSIRGFLKDYETGLAAGNITGDLDGTANYTNIKYYLEVTRTGTNVTFYADDDPNVRTAPIGYENNNTFFAPSYKYFFVAQSYDGGSNQGSSGYIDDFVARHYVEPEPTYTVGPENVFTDWDINSVSFQNPVVETEQQTITIIFFYNSTTVLDFDADLIWNGTDYGSSSEYAGTDFFFINKTFTTPPFNRTENISFLWNYTVFYTNGSIIYDNTSLYFQNVTTIGLDNCSTGNPVAIEFNLTEEEQRGVNITGEFFGSFDIWSGDSSVKKNYVFNFTNSHNFSICINTNQTVYTDAFIQYASSENFTIYSGYFNYTARNYFLDNYELDNITDHIDLALLPENKTRRLDVTLINSQGISLAGYIITIQRLYFSNEYLTVAMMKTDNGGYSSAYLFESNPRLGMSSVVYYKFIVSKDGTTYFETMPVCLVDTQFNNGLTITVNTTIGEWFQYATGISSSCTYTEATTVLRCSVNDATGRMLRVCMNASEIGIAGKTELCQQCSTSSAVTLTCVTGNMSGKTLTWFLFLDMHESAYLLRSGSISFPAVSSYGMDGIVIALFLVLLLSAALGFFDPILGVIGGTSGVVVSYMAGFLTVGWAGLISLVIVAGIIMYRSRWK